MTRSIVWAALAAAVALPLSSCRGRSSDKTGQAEGAAAGAGRAEQTTQQAGRSYAPDFSFTLKDQDGKAISLSDFAGRLVVLEWFNPDCPFVQRHYRAGTMKRLAEEYAAKGVVWLAVNSTHYMSWLDNKKWAEQHTLAYRLLDDQAGNVGKMFGAATTPHMFIFDSDHKLVYQGAIDDDVQGIKPNRVNYVQQALDELLAGRPVSQPRTRPYGCTVKYAQ